MSNYQINLSCISEINLDTLNYNVNFKINECAKRIFDKKVKVKTSSSSIKATSSYKPGGTMIMTVGNYAGRVIDDGNDSRGRWSFQTLSCKNGRNIVVISAYQTCFQTIREKNRVKSLTATAQQTSILKIHDRSITPRKAFTQDLDRLIQKIHDEGNGVLLMGDFNEPLYHSNSGIKKIKQRNHLVDIMWK